VRVGLKNGLLKTLLIVIIFTGLIEYTKIGLSLLDGTYTKKFINVSPFSKGAGEIDSLPPEILDIKTMGEKNNLTTFSLRFSSNDESMKLFITARAIEFLYPARIDSNSRFIFLIGKQQFIKGCKTVDQLHEITLYECAS
jgi:hypothetical protein